MCSTCIVIGLFGNNVDYDGEYVFQVWKVDSTSSFKDLVRNEVHKHLHIHRFRRR